MLKSIPSKVYLMFKDSMYTSWWCQVANHRNNWIISETEVSLDIISFSCCQAEVKLWWYDMIQFVISCKTDGSIKTCDNWKHENANFRQKGFKNQCLQLTVRNNILYCIVSYEKPCHDKIQNISNEKHCWQTLTNDNQLSADSWFETYVSGKH